MNLTWPFYSTPLHEIQLKMTFGERVTNIWVLDYMNFYASIYMHLLILCINRHILNKRCF